MSGDVVGRGVLAVEADGSGFEATLNRLEGAADRFERSTVQAAGRAGAAVGGIGSQAGKGADQMDAASKRFVASVEREIAALTLSRAEYRKFEAQTKGISEGVYGPLIARLAEARKAHEAAAPSFQKASNDLRLVGVSAAQTTAALRTLPAQFTDIATQLAGGGNPFLVLLQQGGQIKDSFGGIGNAARALIGSITPVGAALTAVAAVAGTLGFAFIKGAAEITEYRKALILTGNAAGATVAGLQSAQQAIAANVGTQGKAAEVLAALASTGRVAARDLQSLAEAAIRLEREGGPAIEETVKAFADLGKTPSASAAKLNEQTRFLTGAVYEQIKALEEQGRTTEAASLAQQEYARVTSDRTKEIEAGLGTVERAWKKVKDATKGAVDAVLAIGRASTFEQTLAGLQAQQRQLPVTGVTETAGGAVLAAAKSGKRGQDELNESIGETIRLLQRAKAAADDLAQAQAAAARASEASVKFAEVLDKFRTPQQSLAIQLAQLAETGTAAGKSLKEISEAQRLLTVTSEAFGQSVQETQARIQAAAAVRTERTARQLQDLQALREAGAISEIELIQRTADIQAKAAKDEARDIRATAAAQKDLVGNRATLIQLAGQAAAAEERAAAITQKALDDSTAAIKRKQLAILALTMAMAEEQAAEIGRDRQQEDQQRLAGAKAVQEYARAIDEANERTLLEASLVNATSEARERQLALFDAEIKRRQQIRAIQDNRALGPDDRERETRFVNEATERERTRIQTQIALDEWKKTNEQIAQSLTDALMEGGRSFRDYLVSLMRTTVLRPIIQAVFAPVAGTLASAAQAFTGTGTGAAGAGGNVGQALNFYSAGKTLYDGFAAGFTTAGYQVSSAWGQLAASSFGQSLGLSTPVADSLGYVYNMPTAGANAAGSAFGTVASTAAGAAVGIFGGRAISGGYSAFGNSGNAAVNTGTAVGAVVGSIVPVIGTAVGAAVGGIIGGVVNRLFGLRAPQVESRFITGDVSGSGNFSGNVETNIVQKGGLFRSDRRSQTLDAITGDLDKSLDEGAGKLVELAKRYGAALGLPVDQLSNVSTAIRVEVTDDLTKNTESVTKALTEFADALLGQFADEVEPFRKAGETVAQVIERVGGTLLSVNDVLKEIGIAALATSVDGAKAATELADLFGGTATFAQAAAGYYQKFYTEGERAEKATQQITEALGQFGLQMPATREAFRSLVESQDLTTDSGRRAFTVLLGVADAFDAVQTASAEAQRALEDIARERSGLEEELLRLQGNTVELRQREREALDETNRALYDQIQALKDAQAEIEKQKRLQSTIDGGLDSFLSPEALRQTRAQRIADNLSGIGGTLTADQLLGLSRTQIFEMASAFVRLTTVSTDAKQVVVDAAIALERLVRSAEEAARQAAITDLQGQLDEIAKTFGDLSVIAPQAETVSEAFVRSTNELADLERGFGELMGTIGKTVQETLADMLASQKSLQSFRATLREQIDDTYLRTLSPSARIASLKSKEAALFGQISTATDPVAVAQELQRTILQRIKEEAALRESTLGTEFELTKKLRDEQIKTLRGQIDGFERLRDLAEQMGQFTQSLRFSDLSPLSYGDQLGTARTLFEDTLARAKGGDAFAVGNLQTNARAYLEEARAYFASSAEYASIFQAVTGALDEISAGSVDPQIETLQKQLDALDQLNRTTVDTSAEELAGLQAIDAALAAREAANAAAIETQTGLAREQIRVLRDEVIPELKAQLTQAAVRHREITERLDDIVTNTGDLVEAGDLEAGAP